MTLLDLRRVLGERLDEENKETGQEFFLDSFVSFMSELSPLTDISMELTYLELLLKPLNGETFPELLSLFYTTKSVHIHSKVEWSDVLILCHQLMVFVACIRSFTNAAVR